MAGSSCVCCPYPLVAIPFVLVGLAVIFTWVSAFNCRFYVIRGEIINGNSTDLNVGIWTMEDRIHHYSNAEDNNSWYEDDDNDEWNCALWSEMGPAASTFELDAAMKAARFFSLTAAILSLVAFILILVPFCAAFEDPKVYMRILAGMFITIGLFVMLDLTALASDICTGAQQCALQGTGKLAIGTSFVWFFCAGLMFVTFKVKNAGFPLDRRQASPTAPTTEREVRTVENADGSTTTITKTTVTDSDGNTTVTETTQVTEPPVVESTEQPVPVEASVVPMTATIPVAAVMSVVESNDDDDAPDNVQAKGVP